MEVLGNLFFSPKEQVDRIYDYDGLTVGERCQRVRLLPKNIQVTRTQYGADKGCGDFVDWISHASNSNWRARKIVQQVFILARKKQGM